jgi:hypothetical protein
MLLSKYFSSILGGGDLPQAVHHQLANPPRAGDGVHPWLFTTALILHRHRSPKAIEALLATAVKDCGRQVSAREISDAVKNSAALTHPDGVSGGKGTLPHGSRCFNGYDDVEAGASKTNPPAASSRPAS